MLSCSSGSAHKGAFHFANTQNVMQFVIEVTLTQKERMVRNSNIVIHMKVVKLLSKNVNEKSHKNGK